MIPFIKMDACGNDYIYVDCRQSCEEIQQLLKDPAAYTVMWSDRHHGIGADGLVLIENSTVADAKMRMFNADGSEGAMCGNAIRCVGLLVNETLQCRKLRIETQSGIRELDMEEDGVTVDMGPAQVIAVDQKAEYDGEGYVFSDISMGNPHCVIFVENVETVDIQRLGPLIENDRSRFPDRTNVEFVEIVDSCTLKMRVWERGSGETLACGTGACAAVTAAVVQGWCHEDEEVKVLLRGGELQVRYTKERIFLKGPAVKVFKGWISC